METVFVLMLFLALILLGTGLGGARIFWKAAAVAPDSDIRWTMLLISLSTALGGVLGAPERAGAAPQDGQGSSSLHCSDHRGFARTLRKSLCVV